MNQDFTVEKKQYLSEKKNSCRGVHLKKKFLHKHSAKKFVRAENFPPPSPISFLMVRPLKRGFHMIATIAVVAAIAERKKKFSDRSDHSDHMETNFQKS